MSEGHLKCSLLTFASISADSKDQTFEFKFSNLKSNSAMKILVKTVSSVIVINLWRDARNCTVPSLSCTGSLKLKPHVAVLILYLSQKELILFKK